MKNEEPLISIVLCFFNEENVIKRAIDSILAQTYQNFELLLIDDNSTDSSVQICESYDDARLNVVTKPVNLPKGLACSRNYGVSIASGSFILFQDADDYCNSTRLQAQVELMMECENSIVGCWLEMHKNGKSWIQKYPTSNEEIRRGLNRSYKRNVIAGQVLLYPKWVLEKYPYRLKFKYMQDFDQIFRIEENETIEFRNVPKPLYSYILTDKGVKAKDDWPLYNYFVRVCKKLRAKGQEEPADIGEFRSYLYADNLKWIKWKAFELILKFKINYLE